MFCKSHPFATNLALYCATSPVGFTYTTLIEWSTTEEKRIEEEEKRIEEVIESEKEVVVVEESVTVEKVSLLRKGSEGEEVRQMQVDLPFSYSWWFWFFLCFQIIYRFCLHKFSYVNKTEKRIEHRLWTQLWF